MSGELIRRSIGRPAPRHARSTLDAIVTETNLEQAVIRSITLVGQQAMYDIFEVKNTQKQLEQANPDAAEALSLIANTITLAIGRNVQRFGSEMGG